MYFSDEIILITTDDSGTDKIGRQTETETGRVTVYGDNRAIGFFSCAAEEFDTVLPNGKTVHVALCEKDMQIEKLIDD